MRIIKKPEERKREIITAAKELFTQIGYEKTTIENIISKLGIAKGCFYHYFPSKEKLFEECVESIGNTILASYLQLITSNDKSAKEKLWDYVLYNFELAEQNDSGNMNQSIHSNAFDQIHERIMKDNVKQLMPVFTQLIEEGIAQGDFKVINAEFTAAALLGAFQEIHNLYSHDRSENRETQLELVADLMKCLLHTNFR